MVDEQKAREYLDAMSKAHPGPVIAVICRDTPPSQGEPWGQVHGLPVVHLDRSWAFRPRDAEAVALSYNLGPELAREYLRLKGGDGDRECHERCLEAAREVTAKNEELLLVKREADRLTDLCERQTARKATLTAALSRAVALLREAGEWVLHVEDALGVRAESAYHTAWCNSDCLACRIDAELAKHETPC